MNLSHSRFVMEDRVPGLRVGSVAVTVWDGC